MSLYDSIAMMDTRWEDAYNNCKLDVMEEIISEDLEFYHAMAGNSDLMHVMTDLSDQYNRVVMVSKYENLATYEKSWEKYIEKPEEMKKNE